MELNHHSLCNGRAGRAAGPGSARAVNDLAFGINNRGQVTGLVTDPEGIHSFSLDNDAFTAIDRSLMAES